MNTLVVICGNEILGGVTLSERSLNGREVTTRRPTQERQVQAEIAGLAGEQSNIYGGRAASSNELLARLL